MRIGIFGGSFNPVHEGHIRLAEHAVSELNLDKFFFVPTYRTPLKARAALMPSGDRIAALKKALKNKPFLSLSLCEMRRKGTSYTIDTLRYFEKKFGKKNTFYFITGADTLKTLHRWKSRDLILKKCRFVVATRPGYSTKKLPKEAIFMPFEAIDISSTQIRARAQKAGRAVSRRIQSNRTQKSK